MYKLWSTWILHGSPDLQENDRRQNKGNRIKIAQEGVHDTTQWDNVNTSLVTLKEIKLDKLELIREVFSQGKSALDGQQDE